MVDEIDSPFVYNKIRISPLLYQKKSDFAGSEEGLDGNMRVCVAWYMLLRSSIFITSVSESLNGLKGSNLMSLRIFGGWRLQLSQL